MSEEREECQGCPLYWEDAGISSHCMPHQHGVEADCPCRLCIVKVTCTTTCPDRSNYAQQIMGDWDL